MNAHLFVAVALVAALFTFIGALGTIIIQRLLRLLR